MKTYQRNGRGQAIQLRESSEAPFSRKDIDVDFRRATAHKLHQLQQRIDAFENQENLRTSSQFDIDISAEDDAFANDCSKRAR